MIGIFSPVYTLRGNGLVVQEVEKPTSVSLPPSDINGSANPDKT